MADGFQCEGPGCGRTVQRPATGRPGRYCSGACRQSAHRARVRQREQSARRAAELAGARATADEIRTVAADVVHYARDRQRPAGELAAKLAELRASFTLLERLALGEPGAREHPTRLEWWLFAALDDAGVVYERFAPVGRYIPDAVLPGYMVIIEVDGVIWHRKREAYDRQRDAELTAAGYTVVHLTDLEMTSRGKARALIAEVLASIRDGRQEYRPPMLWPPDRLCAPGRPG